MKVLFHYTRKFEETFLCVMLITMIVLACTQIFMRSAFSSGFLWIDPLLRHLVLWAGLLGGALATAKNQHIAIDLASFVIPEKLKRWVASLSQLFSAIICCFLGWSSVVFIIDEFRYGGEGLLGMDTWVLAMIFPIAFILMSLRYILATYLSVFAYHKPQPSVIR